MMPQMMTTFFETDRLVFRPFQDNDFTALAEINADPAVARFVGDGKPVPAEKIAQWIIKSNENVAHHGFGTGALIEKSTGQLIGWAGFARPENEPMEIIYGLAASYWGQGFGTEVVMALVNQGFSTHGLLEIRATVYPQNIGSIRILTKLGFCLRDACYQSEDDTHLYVLERLKPS